MARSKNTATGLEDEQTDELAFIISESVAALVQEALLYVLVHTYGPDNDLYQRLTAAISGAEPPPPTPDA